MKKISYSQKLSFLFVIVLGICTLQACSDDGDEPKITITDGEYVNGHKAVDLGLSVKWATCNVGADSPEDYGGYYAWGETEEKSIYYSKTYKYYIFDPDVLFDKGEWINIGSDISGTQYDVAHVKWGSSWRMPTKDELDELIVKCKWKWTTYNEVNGMLVTGRNGNKIFLPAAGCNDGLELWGRGSNGIYWSATLCEDYNNNAYKLPFTGGGRGYSSRQVRYNGLTVRPVTE